jgi:hypothetical protein
MDCKELKKTEEYYRKIKLCVNVVKTRMFFQLAPHLPKLRPHTLVACVCGLNLLVYAAYCPDDIRTVTTVSRLACHRELETDEIETGTKCWPVSLYENRN